MWEDISDNSENSAISDIIYQMEILKIVGFEACQLEEDISDTYRLSNIVDNPVLNI